MAEITVERVRETGVSSGQRRAPARRTAWAWIRRDRRTSAPCDPGLEVLRRLEHARVVLERARTIVERGWLQHRWYETDAPPGGVLSLLAARPPIVDDVRSACLVAAVAVAAHGGGPRPDVLADAGPVLDLVWDALEESRGRPGPGVGGRAAPPEARLARMRDLTRWNDVPGRTRPDVMALLDRAISRTILGAVQAVTADRSDRRDQAVGLDA